MIQASKKFIAELNAFKMIIGSIIVALPVLGANISSFYNWSVKVYDLEAELDSKQDKSDSMEVLLYIEDALFDDVTSAKLAIADLKGDENMDPTVRDAIINEHFKSYKDKILNLERIRLKIRSLAPTWKTREEKEDEKRN